MPSTSSALAALALLSAPLAISAQTGLADLAGGCGCFNRCLHASVKPAACAEGPVVQLGWESPELVENVAYSDCFLWLRSSAGEGLADDALVQSYLLPEFTDALACYASANACEERVALETAACERELTINNDWTPPEEPEPEPEPVENGPGCYCSNRCVNNRRPAACEEGTVVLKAKWDDEGNPESVNPGHCRRFWETEPELRFTGYFVSEAEDEEACDAVECDSSRITPLDSEGCAAALRGSQKVCQCENECLDRPTLDPRCADGPVWRPRPRPQHRVGKVPGRVCRNFDNVPEAARVGDFVVEDPTGENERFWRPRHCRQFDCDSVADALSQPVSREDVCNRE